MSRLVGRMRRGLEGDEQVQASTSPIEAPDTMFLRQAYFGGRSAAGKQVTVESSLQASAVWAALRVLADAVGCMPLNVYQRTKGGGRQLAFSAPIYKLLHDRPNSEMTAAVLWRLVTTHLNSWGNAYLGKEFIGNQVVSLWPILPSRVRVARTGGVKQYYVRDEYGRERPEPYTAGDLIHIQGISLDGLIGLSPIQAAQESIGAHLALDEYTNSFFSRGAVPRVALETSEKLSPEAAERLKANWIAKYGGSRNANQVAILEQGLTANVLSVPLRDLQFVELQNYTIQDIARLFRIPPSMIGGDSGKSLTYTTVESDSLHFLTYSVQPWLVLIEQALAADSDLFPQRTDRPSMFPEFLADAMLRADTKSRNESYAIATGNRAWLKPSEVRAKENLPPDDTIDELPPSSAPPPTDAAGGGGRNGPTPGE